MSVRKEVLYRNAKTLLGKPAKRVWFRLNPLLEKTSYFASRRLDHSQFTLPLQSVVVCEKFLEDKPAFQSTCTEADFWDYLWSENWREWGSVRVFEGQLMDCLLEALHRLEEVKAVVSHQTAVFTENVRFTKRPLKGSKGFIKINETMKISFTYYGRRTPAADLVFSSTACSSDTMSMSEFEDASLSDEEYGSCSSEEDQSDVLPAADREKDCEELAHEDDSRASGCRSESPQRSNPNSPYTSYLDWIRHRQQSKDSHSSTSGERSPYQHTMYSLPHFRVSRPTRVPGEDGSLSIRTDRETTPEEPPEPDTSQWLIETTRKSYDSGERTVDRLRKRLQEITEERNRKKKTPKSKVGRHFAEVVKLMDTYGKQRLAVPNMHRCEKVPTFRQYIVQIVEDRTFDPRFRNKRRVQKFSKRYNLHSTSDYSLGPEKQQDQASKDSPKKSSRNKRTKPDLGNFKPRKSPSRMDILSEPPPKTPLEITEDKLDDRSADFVDVVVAITDCEAFRKPLSAVTEKVEHSPEPKGQVLSPSGLRPGPGTSVQRGSSSLRLGDRSDGGRRQKITPSSGNKASYSTLLTHESDSVEGGLAGSYKSRNKRLPAALRESREPISTSKHRVVKKKSGKGHVSLDEEDHYEGSDYQLEHFSPYSQSGTPDAFNARKLNRKYSFEKLKESKHSFAKPKFREVLKKFMKIQKVAAVFRKGALFKPKKLRRQFQNPLHMSPSPEASMLLVNLRSGRRQGLIADMEVQNFSYPNADAFRQQLLKALDEFVVRKEHIISTYKNRSVMSLTFTRPEIFATEI